MQLTVICLMGPTASGKSDISLQLAHDLNAEIISVDSAMVYRGMDIGTAKPLSQLREQVPHHLIDVCDPAEAYSAAQFQQDAIKAMSSIIDKNKIPLLVGGSMLYFKALQKGLSPLPAANKKIREQLAFEAKQIGWQEMHSQLAAVDVESANRIQKTDGQRIQRALEVYRLTGQPLSSLWQMPKEKLPYSFLNIALWPDDRHVLHEKIATRFHEMLAAGLINEVENLAKRNDLHPDLPAIRSVGYRQVWDYLKGTLSYREMEDRAVAATRQLAKHQLTWLRHYQPMTYLNLADESLYSKLLQQIRAFCSLGFSEI